MPHIFVFTAGKPEARSHLDDSIRKPIDDGTVFSAFESRDRDRIEAIRRGAGGSFYAWGAEPGKKNIPNWEQMKPGDYVLCMFDNTYHYVARVLGKTNDEFLADQIWGRNDLTGKTWQYMYFLSKPQAIERPVAELSDYLNAGYRGFAKISDENTAKIANDYGSVKQFMWQEFGYQDDVAEPVDDFLPIMHRYKDEGVVFQSPGRGNRYFIESVDETGCLVARVDAAESARATKSKYLDLTSRVRESGGQMARREEVYTVAIEVALLQGNSLGLAADHKTIADVSTINRAEAVFGEILGNLHTDTDEYGRPRLYKPAVMACILEAVEEGSLTENRIEFDWLVPRAIEKLRPLGVEAQPQSIAYPFFHLTGDLFWMLCYTDPSQPLDGPPSVSSIRERVRYATIKDTYWNAIQDPEVRHRLIERLNKRWFGNDPMEKLAAELFINADWLRRIAKLLDHKRQVMFYGPPGTGKTYIARALARTLAGSPDRVKLVQFHPSYSYEDFVLGYRPKEIGGQPGFGLERGALYEMAKAAEADPDHQHFLVIDEVNRGNLPKVFGELYFLLEYRDEPVRLLYTNEEFTLPPNLHFVCTMNTADRSIALIDSALRRRFHFVPFFPHEPPISGVLRAWLARNKPEQIWLAEVVDEANRMLGDRHAAIGPAHFLQSDLDEEWIGIIWEHSIIPFLEEQFFGEENRVELFRLDRLRAQVEDADNRDEDA